MKKLKKLKVNDAVLMSKSEMKATQGGVSREEYCNSLRYSWYHNANYWSAGAIEGWWHGWSNNCM